MWGLFVVEQYSSYEVERHTSHTKLQGIKRKEPEPFKTMRPTAEKSKDKSPKPSTFISGKESFIQLSSRKHRGGCKTGKLYSNFIVFQGEGFIILCSFSVRERLLTVCWLSSLTFPATTWVIALIVRVKVSCLWSIKGIKRIFFMYNKQFLFHVESVCS